MWSVDIRDPDIGGPILFQLYKSKYMALNKNWFDVNVNNRNPVYFQSIL